MGFAEARQSKRIEDLCQIIWGAYDYELDIETDERIYHQCVVSIDYGSFYGPPPTMTTLQLRSCSLE